MWARWEAKHINELSQCGDDRQREMWVRSLSIAVDIKEKKLIELQRMKEEEQRARIEAENKKREAAEQARLAREISEQAMIELAIAESLKD
jgi:hypothetical protein